MLWFLRRRKKEQAPEEAAAPQPQVEESPALPPEADAGAEGTGEKSRRRRGSRGGRGRKKTVDAAGAGAAAETEPKEEAPPPRPERKPSERKGERGGRSASRRRIQPRRAPLPTAKRELLVSVDVGEQRVAVLEDDQVAEVYLERPGRRSIAGNIYLGVVDNVLPGMEAAFVEIGLEKNGFLYVDEIVVTALEGRRHGRKIQDLLKRIQEILVQAGMDKMMIKGVSWTI